MSAIKTILENLENGNLSDAKRLARPIKGAKLLHGILKERYGCNPEWAIFTFLYLHGEISWDHYCMCKRHINPRGL